MWQFCQFFKNQMSSVVDSVTTVGVRRQCKTVLTLVKQLYLESVLVHQRIKIY